MTARPAPALTGPSPRQAKAGAPSPLAVIGFLPAPPDRAIMSRRLIHHKRPASSR